MKHAVSSQDLRNLYFILNKVLEDKTKQVDGFV